MDKLSRRGFSSVLAAGAAAIAGNSLMGQDGPRNFGPGAQPVRYPDPDLVTLDDEFNKYKIGNTPIKRISQGDLWAEGPAWNGVGNYLIWSDIPNDRQHRWLFEDGHVTTFRKPAGYSNGNTFDPQGRQISCEHGNRRVARYEYNGKVTVLADEARLASDLDVSEAEKVLEEARKALRGEDSTVPSEDAVMEIERATARIRAAKAGK